MGALPRFLGPAILVVAVVAHPFGVVFLVVVAAVYVLLFAIFRGIGTFSSCLT